MTHSEMRIPFSALGRTINPMEAEVQVISSVMVLNEDPFCSVARPGTFSTIFCATLPPQGMCAEVVRTCFKGSHPCLFMRFNLMFQILLQMLTLDICLVLTFCLSPTVALPF